MAEPFKLDYTPPATMKDMMLSDARVRAARGPIGSAKSTAMAMELFRRAIEQKPGKDGIRRTQHAVVRNTLSQLKTTCLVTVQGLFGPLCRWKPSTSEIIFEFDDVYSNWILLPLDTPQNIQRLLSLELTMAWISEFREITPEIVRNVYSRCGRYPSMLNGGATYYGVVMETNSFAEDSPWFDELEVALPGNWDYFVQPPGVTIEYADDDTGQEYPLVTTTGENHENLPPTYYTDQIDSNGGIDSNWVRQYIFNEIAPSVAGEAVFRENFEHNFHVAPHEIHAIDHTPLCIGLDQGRNPAAVITQADPTGVIRVLGEVHGQNMGMETFVVTLLKPLLSQMRYVGLPIYIVADPASRNKNEVGEESVLMALKRLGFVAVLASTNNIAPRLRAVDSWLQMAIRGKAALQFCPVNCSTLVLAMGSRYRFKRKKDGSLDENTPDKNHPYSDIADCLQYALLGSSERVRARAIRTINRPTNVHHNEPTVGAWT
tara:strand:- start:5190 stop:6653 length:1464 start_codon:yes stop_codon:yes gene_type:complete